MFILFQFSKIAGEITLTSGQTKSLMMQEECWEFFADNMAPFTSSQSLSLRSNCFSGAVMQEEQAKDVISSFFRALAICLNDAETSKVKTTPKTIYGSTKNTYTHLQGHSLLYV